MAGKTPAPKKTSTGIEPGGASTSNKMPIGDTGLKQYGGYIREEFLTKLIGQRGARVYREMVDNDSVVHAVVFAITSLIRQVKWTVQAADDSPAADDGKTFIEECMGDAEEPWSDIIAEACTMFIFGYAPMEITYKQRGGPNANDPASLSKYDDNLLGWRSISLRGQNSVVRWVFDEANGDKLLGLVQQRRVGSEVVIPIEKMLLFRTTSEKNNPEGRSILRSAYRAWYIKSRVEDIESIGIERDLAGLPMARIPGYMMRSDADPLDKAIFQNWKDLVTKIKRDQQEGIVIPSDRDAQGEYLYDLELLTSGGTRAFDTSKVVDRWNRMIATSALADFMFLGQSRSGGGSLALSVDKTEMFTAALTGFVDMIADVFNRQLVARTWALNGLPVELMPTLKPGDLERKDIGALGQLIQALAAAGMPLFPDRELENHIREAAGLPQAPEDQTMMLQDAPDPANPNADPNADPTQPKKPANRNQQPTNAKKRRSFFSMFRR